MTNIILYDILNVKELMSVEKRITYNDFYEREREINRKIFEIAYKGGQLEDILCGIGPYDFASHRIGAIINTGEIMDQIYAYYSEKRDEALPVAFSDALSNLAKYKTFMAVYVVMEIDSCQIRAEKEGRAPFMIEHERIVEELRLNLERNAAFYSQAGELRGYKLPNGMRELIAYYKELFLAYGYMI